MGVDRHSVELNHSRTETNSQTTRELPYTRAMTLATLIGFTGGALVLFSFGGAAVGRIDTRGAAYQALNLAGALAMIAAGLPARAWPSVTVNVVWALISAYGFVRARTPESPPVTAEHSIIA
jgi:hypothetical protein